MTGVWAQLRSAALIGSARQPLPKIDVDAPTARLVSQVEATETGTLLAAGALAVARRSGVAPADVGVGALPEPAPDIDAPLPPDRAAQRLRSLLADGADVDHLTLWLRLARERGLRAPARDLPALFRAGRAQRELRPLAAAVAGERGRWLAAQRSEWSWVFDTAVEIDPGDDRAWHEGNLAERTGYLAAARRHDPASARKRLENAWPAEPPAERAAFLAVLADGLGPDDEAFCEAALDDRRKEVRAVAAGLLADLDGSGFQRRMTARSRTYVVAGRRIAVRPPVECDASMRRDGIEPKPPAGAGAGERAWWLEQVIAATPPSEWSDFGKSPAHILGLRVEPGWQQTLHRAWARAAVRTRDAHWAEALIDAGFGTGKSEMHDVVLGASLYDVLPPDTLIDRTLRLLGGRSAPDLTVLGTILDACPQPWPPPVADALLGLLQELLSGVTQPYMSPRLRSLATTIVTGMAPEAIVTFQAMAERLRAQVGATPAVTFVDSLLLNVSVRLTIFQEFA